MRAFLFDLSAVEELRLSRTVIGDSGKTDPAVDTDDIGDLRQRKILYLIGDRDAKEEPAVFEDQFRRTERAAL